MTAPSMISADSHVIEPADLSGTLRREWGDRAPHVVRERPRCSDAERRAVLCDNAASLYGIDAAALSP
jgi:hypothetical protein